MLRVWHFLLPTFVMNPELEELLHFSSLQNYSKLDSCFRTCTLLAPRGRLYYRWLRCTGKDLLDAVLIAWRRSNQQRKINNVSDGIGTEQARGFLDFLQVLRYHAERK